MRAIKAKGMVPTATAGKMMCFDASQKDIQATNQDRIQHIKSAYEIQDAQ